MFMYVCMFRGVCSFDLWLGICICKGLTSVACRFSTLLVVGTPKPCLVEGLAVLQNPILVPGRPSKVQSRNEETNLDFTKVTEKPSISHRGH